MRLAASFVAAALGSTVLATWSTAARADDPGSLSPPLNPSEAPAPPMAPEPAASPDAMAPPAPAYELPARKERDHWYGKDILVTDGVSIGAGLGLGLASPGAGLGVFAGGYALGGPLVHLAHGRPLAALGSLALRLGAPTIGLITGYSIAKVSDRSDDDDSGPAALLGVILGYGAAISIDAALLAHESEDAAGDPESGSRKRAAPPSAAFSWAPTVAPIREGGMVGIGGRF